MPKRLKAYYLHNIDGRRCGMIAVSSKSEVRAVVRIAHSEIEASISDSAGTALALAAPGVLFVQPIISRDPVWVRDGRVHPAYTVE